MDSNKDNLNKDELAQKIKDAKKQAGIQDSADKREEDPNISSGARAGVELVGAMIGGGLIGYLLDSTFETFPMMFILFFLLGCVTGFYNVYKITQNL